MAYGNYNNNKKQGPYDPTVYTPYKFNNARSTVDQTQLSFQYWNNSLRCIIAPRNQDSPEDQPTFDIKNSISAYLNHTKARMFATVLRGFLSDPEAYDNCGVAAGSSLITVTTGKEFNSKFPLIVIRKVDESGSVTASFAYEVKGDFHFSVKGFSESSNGQFDKVFYPNLELEQILTVLDEFTKAETRAVAYSVMDSQKYDMYRMSTKLDRLGAKLGVDMNVSSGGSTKSSSTSYFSRDNGSSSAGSSEYGDAYQSATLDDLE